MTGVEMVRPHDLRPGDRIRVAGEVHTVSSRPLPMVSARRQRLVVLTDLGRVSWTVVESVYPQVERVERARDRQVA